MGVAADVGDEEDEDGGGERRVRLAGGLATGERVDDGGVEFGGFEEV